MATEIERKFLVTAESYKAEAFCSSRIAQGYLSTAFNRSVRIRIKGEKGYITIKGKSDISGMARFEWEKEIPVDEAAELLALCEPGRIDKTRYEVKSGEHIFEVDEFHGENNGLVVAEIELSSVDEFFIKPVWIGREVTGENKYYNSMLIKHPYSEW